MGVPLLPSNFVVFSSIITNFGVLEEYGKFFLKSANKFLWITLLRRYEIIFCFRLGIFNTTVTKNIVMSLTLRCHDPFCAFSPGTLLYCVKLLNIGIQQSKLLPIVDIKSHFWHSREDTKPHSNSLRADKWKELWPRMDINFKKYLKRTNSSNIAIYNGQELWQMGPKISRTSCHPLHEVTSLKIWVGLNSKYL